MKRTRGYAVLTATTGPTIARVSMSRRERFWWLDGADVFRRREHAEQELALRLLGAT